MDREKITAAFDKYVKEYDLENPKIRLKYEHTFHVAANCEAIAEDVFENGTICPAAGTDTKTAAFAVGGRGAGDRAAGEGAADTAWLIGMLHDIGRFEQLKRFDTFNDSLSIDHAAFGADLLFGPDRLIENFTDRRDLYPLIEEAIRDHSLYRIPKNLDPVTKAFCDIIRDADKIDILRVNFAVPQSDIYSLPEEEIAESAISPEVLEIAMRENRAIPRDLHRTPADHFVGHICLCYELVYEKSRQMAVDQGYLEKLFAYPFTKEKTRASLQELKEHMKKVWGKQSA